MLLSIRNPQSAIRNGRSGVTLTEVLLAIFVMGIILNHINREFSSIDTSRLSSLKE